MSWAIASSIFRMFSACCCSWLWVLNFDSFVTPSTSWATSAPNRSSTSVRLYSVSSGTSWRSAAWIATGSSPSSARIWADAIGWVTYGSPGRPPLALVGRDGEIERALDRREVGARVLREDGGVEVGAERLEVESRLAGAAASAPRARLAVRRGRGGVCAAFGAASSAAACVVRQLVRALAAAGSSCVARCVAMGRKDSSGLSR